MGLQTDGRLVRQEAVRGFGSTDGRRDGSGRLHADPSVPRVARLRLPGLEERLAGHSGLRGDGVCFRQATELHLHEGLETRFLVFVMLKQLKMTFFGLFDHIGPSCQSGVWFLLA